MSKYLSLTWEYEWKNLLLRVYINVFAIFLRIPLLPMSINKRCIWFYYKGDEIGLIHFWRRSQFKWISMLWSGTGEFGSASFRSLKELDNYWIESVKICKEYSERN